MDEFYAALLILGRACSCPSVNANEHTDMLMRDAFVAGMQSSQIRQRLLEKESLGLSEARALAASLDVAARNTRAYGPDRAATHWAPYVPVAANPLPPPHRLARSKRRVAPGGARCYFCGQAKHPRQRCPACAAICKSCGKKGHYAVVCRSRKVAAVPGAQGALQAVYAPQPPQHARYDPQAQPLWVPTTAVLGELGALHAAYAPQPTSPQAMYDPPPALPLWVPANTLHGEEGVFRIPNATLTPTPRPTPDPPAPPTWAPTTAVPGEGAPRGPSARGPSARGEGAPRSPSARGPNARGPSARGPSAPQPLQTAKALNLTYNEDKCVFSTDRLAILGYVVRNGIIGPDPERMRALMEFPLPHCPKALKRCLAFFSYYAQWVPQYADKARPLIQTTTFPLSTEACQAFSRIKADIAKATMRAIDESLPFQVESDASDVALAATLNQVGRPVAFFSWTLHASEIRHSSVEKKAQAIVEAVRHWRHYLAGRRFTLLTDQRLVAFMFDNAQRGKITNDKILRWRIELSTFNYEILYRPGKLNEPSDAPSRGTCANAQINRLQTLHEDLCHPGVTRFYHFIKSRNLPYSLEEVRTVTRDCHICAECKPHFFRPDGAHLIQASRPFERLSLDFKGPLPSTDRNAYFLNVVDEYSRFPFAIPCSDMTAATVIKALNSIFTLFGYPAYVHSDRGSSFMSDKLRQFLLSKGIASSRTTSYNPRGNGQVKRENGTVWKAVLLALWSRDLPVSRWQEVLPDALHSIRSLLCTSTNQTPQERLLVFPRRSSSGMSLPTWLAAPGPILLQKHVRAHKEDPLVERVHLLHANPQYAYVEYPDGRQDTVSLRDLAPAGNTQTPPTPSTQPFLPPPHPATAPFPGGSVPLPSAPTKNQAQAETVRLLEATTLVQAPPPPPGLRRSTRTTRPPDRLVASM
ncbi:uncharacterized protein [Scyliorhinus torazame]|uniref:uncharacterized protein n=1 Tax=Scyliorhinus torazame TaxID=75743 RepID=UPI003B5BDCC8